ncbi:hypothetical protein KCM76_24930 [Zooshikella marina]|uniref:tetratricopeptide repeat protein n=1 Tax=Zooshikella ganghwensis TaxID=202772 RepID=UPI001BAEC80F|nr:hypothetical protein [Zooshikella ganghwensis]MBU2709264.1 hypothetical protein [Zooshikella ganghwensis]
MALEVIFKSRDGKVLTAQELENVNGSVNWEIKSDKAIPSSAIALHSSGREYGQRGENEKAIVFFNEAIKIAPHWSYPYYDLAYTYLLSNDFKQAYKYYKKVNELSPNGFFTAKTAFHYLDLERKGKYPEGLYLYYLSHEWGKTPQQQFEIFSKITAKFPDYSPAWEKLAGFYDNPSKKLEAIEKGLSGDPDKETEGFLLINKAVTLFNNGDKQSAINILGELALDPYSPTDIKVISKRTLSMLIKSEQ